VQTKLIVPLIFSLILVSWVAPGAFAAGATVDAQAHKSNFKVHKSSTISHKGVVAKFVHKKLHPLVTYLYDGGDPDFQNGNEMTQWTQANCFVLNQANVISHVDMWTVESGPWDGTATWFIYSDNNGQPGALVATGSGTGISKSDLGPWSGSPGFEMYSYSFNLNTPPTLQPGNYWLGLHFAKDWSVDDNIYWATGPAVNILGQEDFSNQLIWASNGVDHAFKLTGYIPPVGGMGIPIDTTALLLAGVQGSALWMVPAIVVAGAGIGIISYKRSKKQD